MSPDLTGPETGGRSLGGRERCGRCRGGRGTSGKSGQTKTRTSGDGTLGREGRDGPYEGESDVLPRRHFGGRGTRCRSGVGDEGSRGRDLRVVEFAEGSERNSPSLNNCTLRRTLVPLVVEVVATRRRPMYESGSVGNWGIVCPGALS